MPDRRMHAAALSLLFFFLPAVAVPQITMDLADAAVPSIRSAVRVNRAGQLSLAPTGERIAIADRFGDRIMVIDSRGRLQWSVGDRLPLSQPQAVLLGADDRVIFSQWDSPLLLGISSQRPEQVDTVADLSGHLPAQARILKLYSTGATGRMVLTDHPASIWVCDSSWSAFRQLVVPGTKGIRTESITDLAMLPGGELVVTGSLGEPLQWVDKRGGRITSAEWNSTRPHATWIATSVAIDQQQRIWVADQSARLFRRYSPTGTLLGRVQLADPASYPVGMAVTSDNLLVVVTSAGDIDLYDLAQEEGR